MVHGDARRPVLQEPRGLLPPHHCLLLLWSSNSRHSTHYGRLVGLLTRPAITLVRLGFITIYSALRIRCRHVFCTFDF